MRAVVTIVLVLVVACRGSDDSAAKPPPPVPPAVPRPISIGVDDGTVLVLLDDGTLRGWGRGHRGMLGDPHGADRATPMKLPWVRDVSDLVVGSGTACARTRAGAWWCWGRDRVPAIDPNLAGARTVVLGGNFGCALRANGTVGCWGFAPGHFASSVFETRLPATSPHAFAEVPELHDVTALASSDNHVCAVEADGSVWCWGNDSRGQVSGAALPLDRDRVVDKPTKVASLAHAVDLAVAYERSCAHVGGSTWCWGAEGAGPRPSHGPFVGGDGLEVCEQSAAGIQCGPRDAVIGRAFAGDLETTCTIGNDDIVRCAGANPVGQLGDGTLVSRAEAKPVRGLVEGRGDPLPAPEVPAGARAPAWDGAPCKHDATLQFSVANFATTPFVVRGSFARLAADMPYLAIDLSDHPVTLDGVGGTPKVAGDQRTIQLLIVNYDAKLAAVALARGRYPLRHPAPGKAGEVHVWGSSSYASNIDDKPGFTGTIELDSWIDGWVCGSIDATGPAGTIRGAFAAELVP